MNFYNRSWTPKAKRKEQKNSAMCRLSWAVIDPRHKVYVYVWLVWQGCWFRAGRADLTGHTGEIKKSLKQTNQLFALLFERKFHLLDLSQKSYITHDLVVILAECLLRLNYFWWYMVGSFLHLTKLIWMIDACKNVVFIYIEGMHMISAWICTVFG